MDTSGQNVIGDFLTGLAQTILIIAAQSQNLEAKQQNQYGDNSNSNLGGSNRDLQKQIDGLKAFIKKFDDN